MSGDGEEPKALRVSVTVWLADGSARTITADQPDKVVMEAWREPVDLFALAGDPVDMAPSGAHVSLTGGTISTGYIPAAPGGAPVTMAPGAPVITVQDPG